MLALLDDQLVELLVSLVPLVVLFLALLAGCRGDHDDGSGALGAAGGTQLGARRKEDVRDVVVLAEDGDVADDVHGADVGGEDDNGGSRGLGCGRVGGCGFADGLDDFFDTTLEALLLCGCVDLFSQRFFVDRVAASSSLRAKDVFEDKTHPS